MKNFSAIHAGSAPSADPDYMLATGIYPQRTLHTARAKRPHFYEKYGKRTIDLAVTVLMLPILFFLIGFIVIAVWFQGGAPVYTQKRVGRDGRIFTLFKIRSMVRNADEILATHLEASPEARQEWDHHQKLRNDPRITPLGRFIRKTSLDELPQFWNVLKGDMSLIGPRPFMDNQGDLYPGSTYYDMRPGLSGLWQISERSESSFEERAVYDDEYYYNLSLDTDIRIFAKTFGVVVNGSGV